MSFHHHVLPNGLTIVGETSPSARSVAVGFFVRTGARDETPSESGVSHFLEHMVFKGTSRRSALDVNYDFDRIGADNNAFTSEENTVFYAAVLPEYLPQAVDILADILRPSLRGDDFDMEKKVIIEEIARRDDHPWGCAFDSAQETFFADHPLGKSVLGTVQSITDLTRDSMQAYYDRRYTAPNITVSIAGNFVWEDAVKLVEVHCGKWPAETAARDKFHPVQARAISRVIKKEKLKQERVVAMAPAPAADAPHRYAADVLAMIIGDGSGSRYYWALVDSGLAEDAEMGFHDYEGTGAYVTAFSCEPENAPECLAIIQEILREVQREGVSGEELAIAKSKILSRVVRGSERPMGRMQALGIDWTYRRTYHSVDEELARFETVSLKELRDALDRYPLDPLTVLALGPLAGLD